MHFYGCCATFVDGLTEHKSYMWSSMPQLKGAVAYYSSEGKLNDHYQARIYGGYASGKEIKMFGELRSKNQQQIDIRNRQNPFSSKVKCWTLALTVGPTSCATWSEDTSRKPTYHNPALITIQHCYKYDVYCYTSILFIIDNNDETMGCSFLVQEFNKHVKCVIIDDTIFIVNGSKMAKIENVKSHLSPITDPPTKPTDRMRQLILLWMLLVSTVHHLSLRKPCL